MRARGHRLLRKPRSRSHSGARRALYILGVMGMATDTARIVVPRLTGAILLGFVLAATVLGGCSSTPAAAPATTTSGNTTNTTSSTTAVPPASSSTTGGATAPCTQQAISAAAMHATSIGPVLAVNGFACSGSWAYGGVAVGTSLSNSVDAVIVLQINSGTWVVADRATACSNHLVPSAIYAPACTTS